MVGFLFRRVSSFYLPPAIKSRFWRALRTSLQEPSSKVNRCATDVTLERLLKPRLPVALPAGKCYKLSMRNKLSYLWQCWGRTQQLTQPWQALSHWGTSPAHFLCVCYISLTWWDWPWTCCESPASPVTFTGLWKWLNTLWWVPLLFPVCI